MARRPRGKVARLRDPDGFFGNDGFEMSVRYIFRCQFCKGQPDPLTQLALEASIREATFGAYQDALPG
ncbi:MAG: hypothetical protein QOE11_1793, partial [Solirubrobacteraceae bacterium]|nr:hypothetical protein [Solirubrobacteraceae bacterium]